MVAMPPPTAAIFSNDRRVYLGSVTDLTVWIISFPFHDRRSRYFPVPTERPRTKERWPRANTAIAGTDAITEAAMSDGQSIPYCVTWNASVALNVYFSGSDRKLSA